MTRMTAIEMIKNAKQSASSPNIFLSYEQELRSLRLSLIETARERDEAIEALKPLAEILDDNTKTYSDDVAFRVDVRGRPLLTMGHVREAHRIVNL